MNVSASGLLSGLARNTAAAAATRGLAFMAPITRSASPASRPTANSAAGAGKGGGGGGGEVAAGWR